VKADSVQWLSIGAKDSLVGDTGGPSRDFLPSSGSDAVTASQFITTALLPYYSDEYLYPNGNNAVTYQINGDVGSRTVTFHWATNGELQGCGYFEFFVVFQEAVPNDVTYFYDQMILCNNPQGLVGASSTKGQSEQYLSLSTSVYLPVLQLVEGETTEYNAFPASQSMLIYDPVANAFNSAPWTGSCLAPLPA